MITRKQISQGLIGMVLGSFLAYETWANAYRVEPTYRALVNETSKLTHEEYGVIFDICHSIDFKNFDLNTRKEFLRKLPILKLVYRSIDMDNLTQTEIDWINWLREDEYGNGFKNIGMDIEEFENFRNINVKIQHVPTERDAIFVFREWYGLLT